MADEELRSQKCTVCRKGAPQVTGKELEVLLRAVPEWKVTNVAGVRRLERVFTFQDFASALDFTIRIGAAAEMEGHHPAILTEWGHVTVTWWTHKIGGLHRNDFIMAAKTDAVAGDRARGDR